MLCHWPGMYCNGLKTGFEAFKGVVIALESRFKDQTLWMKVSEIGRYWAAKQVTKISRVAANTIEIDSPLRCKDFTIAIDGAKPSKSPILEHQGKQSLLQEVASVARLRENSFVSESDRSVVCLNAPKGTSRLIY